MAPVNETQGEGTSCACRAIIAPMLTPGSATGFARAAYRLVQSDTIEFDTELVVDAQSCPKLGTDPSDYYVARATESLTIVGNGAVFQGGQAWIDGSDRINPSVCPQGGVDYVLEVSPGNGELRAVV